MQYTSKLGLKKPESTDAVDVSDFNYNAEKMDDFAKGLAIIPTGLIAMWSGTITNIPSGWALCNGSNGTPDLRNKFIVGAGDSYNVGNTGGSNSVSLSESEMPSHSHGYEGVATASAASPQILTALQQGPSYLNNYSGTTDSAGSGYPHENRPPYYALAYIMKVGD